MVDIELKGDWTYDVRQSTSYKYIGKDKNDKKLEGFRNVNWINPKDSLVKYLTNFWMHKGLAIHLLSVAIICVLTGIWVPQFMLGLLFCWVGGNTTIFVYVVNRFGYRTFSITNEQNYKFIAGKLYKITAKYSIQETK